ncbi:complement component receptor 1-like protein isoform X2 [Hoplias malabaricus]|uniref:complement component receptor 1-like protein isoform X2 n=1 Tax=Hoplias malabaricus TaxID=27720 RepID=UPI0034621FA7
MKMLFYNLILLTFLLKVVNIRAQCEKPLVGKNRVLTTESIKTTYTNGSIATFKCEVGYKPANRQSKSIVCIEGQWTDLKFECQKKSCGSLPDIANGRYIINDGIEFGATVRAECNQGFLRFGPAERRCMDAGWDGRAPLCEGVKCLQPPTIANGDFEEPPYESYEYGQTVTYNCKRGFTLIGSAIVSCLETGDWDPTPKCVGEIFCEQPNIAHATRIEGRAGPYKYKSFVRYQCDKGYKMEGADYIVCKENGWEPPPPNCPAITCNEPEVQNGHITEGRAPYKYNIKVQISCNEGFRLVGDRYLVCGDNGWNTPMPQCVEVTCNEPVIPNGHKIGGDAPFKYNSTVQISCNKGYRLEVDENLVCRDIGWNPPQPWCVERTCENPDVPNGHIVEVKARYTYNTKVQISCNEGYRLEGDQFLVCGEIGWTQPLPQCVEVTCNEPVISNGYKVGGDAPYKNNSMVQISCNQGYRLNVDKNLVCKNNGWNPPLPWCVEVTCNEPVISNGHKVGGHTNADAPYKYNSTVQISCKEGYKLEVDEKLVCKDNGWNPPLPWCVEIPRRWVVVLSVVGVSILLILGAALLYYLKKIKFSTNTYSGKVTTITEESKL